MGTRMRWYAYMGTPGYPDTVEEVWTNDRGFLKLPSLRVHHPLVEIHPTDAGERGARDVTTAGTSGRKRPRRRPASQRG